MGMTLLETLTGSRLYGNARADSDYDRFIVIANRPRRNNRAKYAKQRIVGQDDTLTTDLSTLMRYASMGVPQYLEAIFSRQATVDRITELRYSYRCNLASAVNTYQRTIKNFAEGNQKQRRHALRLCLNLDEILDHARFNPTLTSQQWEWIYDVEEDDRLYRATLARYSF